MKHLLSVFLLLVLCAPTPIFALDYRSLPIPQLKEYAEKGDAGAQFELGRRYKIGWRDKDGNGVQKDLKEAAKWFRKSAEQGNSWAQIMLGICYEYAIGVQKDLKEAATWYRKAAEQGLAVAQNSLGDCYYNGQGVQKDFAEAVKWYHKAAEQGHAPAQYNFGDCYHYGYGVQTDLNKAVTWYRKAAEQGHAPAQWNLGICYEYAIGVQQDLKEAANWYAKAAAQGYENAKSALAKLEKSTQEQKSTQPAVAKPEPLANANNRILYLAEEKPVKRDGAMEFVETDTPFVIDITAGAILYPEKYKSLIKYKKEDFTEKEEEPTLAAQLTGNKLLLTIKSTFRPARIKIKNISLPQDFWADGISIKQEKDSFLYHTGVTHALNKKDKSMLQKGMKVTVATQSGREFERVLKETGGKVVVEEYKAAEF